MSEASIHGARSTSDREIRLVIQQTSTECGSCGYGRGGWAASPALKGEPILTPESRVCHGCGKSFTHIDDVYAGTLTPIVEGGPSGG